MRFLFLVETGEHNLPMILSKSFKISCANSFQNECVDDLEIITCMNSQFNTLIASEADKTYEWPKSVSIPRRR